MASDIGVKMSVGGESSFSTSIKAIDAHIKSLNAQLGEAVSAMDGMDNSEEATGRKTEALSGIIEANQWKIEAIAKQYDAAKEKLAKLSTAVADATAAHGADSVEAQKATDAYNRQETVVAGLETQMAKAQTAINDTKNSMGDAGEATDDYSGKVTGLADVLSVKLVGEAVGKMQDALVAVGQKILEVGQQMWDMATNAGTWADSLVTTSTATGISAEKLQEWSYAARFVDTEVDTVQKSMVKLTKSMTSSSTDTTAAFTTLGVSVRDQSGQLRDSETVFWEAIDALGQISNETERDSIAMTVFGKSAQDLNPLITAGADTWNAYCEEARNAGVVLEDDGVTALGAFDDAMQRNDAQVDALKNQLAAALAPALTTIADKITAVVKKFQDWAKTDEGQATIQRISDAVVMLVENIGDNLVPIMETIIGTMTGIGEAIAWLVENGDTLLAIITIVVAALGTLQVAMTIAAIATAAATAPVTGVVIAVTAVVAAIAAAVVIVVQNWDAIKAAFVAAWESIKTTFEPVGEFFTTAWTSITTAFADVGTFFSTAFTNGWTSITTAFSTVGTFFAGVWTSVTGAFSNALTGFATIGTNMIQGLWNGINDAATWLWDLVSGWCTNLVDKIKGFFGIQSPSKLMRDEVGVMLGRGVAEGITDATDDVQNAYDSLMPDTSGVTRAMDQVKSSMQGSDITMGFDAGSLAYAIAQALAGTYVRMDGQTVGELVTGAVSAAMGQGVKARRYAV